MSVRAQNEHELNVRARAKKVLPGGGFGNVAYDLVIRSGSGGRVTDVSGNTFVDFLLGSGPMLIGHAHPDVVAAVTEQVARGSTFYADNEPGILLAEAIAAAVPAAEHVRFCSTGTEATFFAMRLARAWTGREKILKFEGGFHGMNDYALMSMAPKRPGNFPVASPDSAGIPEVLRGEVLIAPFNDADGAVALIEAHAGELAGIIVEPMQRLIPPKPGFLAALREAATKHGVALIFDEIVTGFRLAYGGATEYYGVKPDIVALGKVIGGGFPLAAIAGRRDIMVHFDKAGAPGNGLVLQTGTLNGNPVAAVAGLVTLEVLRRPGAYEKLFATGNAIRAGLEGAIRKAGLAATVVGEPPLFDVVFARGEMSDYRTTARGDASMLKRFNALLAEHGVIKGDNKIYVSCAHDAEDVERATVAFEAVCRILARRET